MKKWTTRISTMVPLALAGLAGATFGCTGSGLSAATANDAATGSGGGNGSGGGMAKGSGGVSASGGSTATGGSPGSGGAPGSGGVPGSGGAGGASRGGTSGTGGGGRPGMGSAGATGPMGGAAGRAATGGAPATGGTTSSPDGGARDGTAAGGAIGSGGGTACTALFCEDFESGGAVPDQARWNLEIGYNPGELVALESTMVKHGSFAAHAHLVETEGGFARMHETATFPALADGLWGRASFYSSVAATAGHTAYVAAYVGTSSVLEIGESNGTWQLTYYNPSNGGSEAPRGYPGMVPRNRWVCLEWHLVRAPASGGDLIQIYVDGTEVASYAGSGENVPPFTALALGLENHSDNPAGNDLYLDDVAIDAARIGCPTP